MSERKSTYTCEAQQRLLTVMLALAGHEFDGLSLTEISTALAIRSGKAQKNSVFRDLHNLKEAGLAEQLPDSDKWRLTPRLVQIAQSYTRNIARIGSRFDEIQQRYSREP